LQELQDDNGPLPQKLKAETATSSDIIGPVDEKLFRWESNEDAMATEKLADGIRRFSADQIELENQVRQKASAA
jgi:transaldolase